MSKIFPKILRDGQLQKKINPIIPLSTGRKFTFHTNNTTYENGYL